MSSVTLDFIKSVTSDGLEVWVESVIQRMAQGKGRRSGFLYKKSRYTAIVESAFLILRARQNTILYIGLL